MLGMSNPDYFNYLKGEVSCSIDDVDEYSKVKNSLNLCNISKQDQYSIFEIVAGILHLGNIEFVENDTGYSSISDLECFK